MGEEVVQDELAVLQEQIRQTNLQIHRTLAEQSAATAAAAATNAEAFAASEAALSGIAATTTASAELLRTLATRLSTSSAVAPAGAPASAEAPAPAPPDAALLIGLGDKPLPPTDSWVNEPQPGHMCVDPNTFRLPAKPRKDLVYHDIMKAESSAVSVLGTKLSYNRKFSESYNNDAFLHCITTHFKTEAKEFETAEDMYRGNNALSTRKRIERIAWAAKDGEPLYRCLQPSD